MAFQGNFTITETGISGWARKENDSGPVWVEALDGDESLGCALASLSEPAGCGFWLPLPPFALDNNCEIRVRIANTAVFLAGNDAMPEAKNGVAGELFVDRGLCLSGWAVDKSNPDARLRLRIMEKGAEIADGLACRPAKGPEANGHAFVLHLPVDYADGQEHTLEVVDEKGRHLPGSPVNICCQPYNMAAWLENRKNFGEAERALFIRLLRYMEMRSPGVLPQEQFSVWKQLFATVELSGKNKFSLAVRIDGKKAAGNVRIGKMANVNLQKDENLADHVLLLAAGEKLHARAVCCMAEAMEKTGAALAYADSEDCEGKPLLKQAWDLDAFLAHDYLGPMLVKRKLLQNVADCGDYSVMRFNLALEAEKSGGITHVAMPLTVEKTVQNDAARVAKVNSWLKQRNPASEAVEMDNMPVLRIRHGLRSAPRISVVIPTRDHADMLGRCLESLRRTDWENLELVIVDNGSEEPAALEILRTAASAPNTVVLRDDRAFNYADLNNEAVGAASGELICFLNNDTEIIEPHWLREMAALLLSRPDNGCVGAKLLWPNMLVQHGGVVVGMHQLAAHAGNAWLADEPGYMWRNQYAQQYSAVTAACMLTPRKLFQELGGFDGRKFAVNFNDTDYCLRLRQAGKRVLWTPFAKLLHHESASRGKDESPARKAGGKREMLNFRTRWGTYKDPFYNPNLALSVVVELFYGLAVPPGTGIVRHDKQGEGL